MARMPDGSDLPPALDQSLTDLDEAALADLIRRVADELCNRATRESFAQLLQIVGYVGERVGDSARLLAAANSWSQVAEISGTSRQAAWERWRLS